MEGNTTPNTTRGEVAVTIAGKPTKLRFSLAVLHTYCTTSSRPLATLGEYMSLDTLGTIGGLLAAAVSRATGKKCEIVEALDLMEEIPQKEGDALAAAIWAAIKVDKNPLLSALIAQAPKPAPKEETEPTSGTSTSALPTAS